MNSDVSKNHPIADNRKRVKLERLSNPLSDPGFKTLVKIADKLKDFHINLNELGLV